MNNIMPARPDNWPHLTPEQKRAWRLAQYTDSYKRIKFVSPEAELRYKTSLKRMADVYRVLEPDRVPVAISAGVLPLYSNGVDYYTAIYEPEKAVQATTKFNAEHAAELDGFASSMTIHARAFDILDYRLYAYPGHGMSRDGVGFQFVEGEYMKPDEYDALIKDPSDFWLRTYLPRIFGALKPLNQLAPLTDIIEIVAPLNALAKTEVQTALLKLVEAGQEMARTMKITDASLGQSQEHGYGDNQMPGAFAKAPFDTLGDTLRGTRGIMTDMYRQPDKLLEAMDVMANLTIKSILNSPGAADGLMVLFPLHKGADGWMSQKQFDTFYWPPLKKVMDAFINEGMIVSLFAEGSYNTRLESVNVFPKGAVHWHFDQTDMAKAKQVLGKDCSLEGNVPSSLLCTGSPAEVREYCRKLIEICAPGGGYILNAGALPEFPKLENLKAMVAAAHEYGVYR
jgi:uroporphyrinogen-III decarboxylase